MNILLTKLKETDSFVFYRLEISFLNRVLIEGQKIHTNTSEIGFCTFDKGSTDLDLNSGTDAYFLERCHLEYEVRALHAHFLFLSRNRYFFPDQFHFQRPG